MNSQDIPKVALCVPKIINPLMDLLLAYVRERELWQLMLVDENPTKATVRQLREWGCNGLILHGRSHSEFSRALELDVPTVVIEPPSLRRNAYSRYSITRVDNAATSDTVAEFFLSRGFTHFAYFGDPGGAYWSVEREVAFASRLRQKGFTCAVFKEKASRLGRWLAALSKPCALFAANDFCARQVIDACRTANIPVPDAISVIGVDNKEWLCETTIPTISSVAYDSKPFYWDIFSHLSARMRNPAIKPRTFYELPAGVHVRASTAVGLTGFTHIDRARSYIASQEGVCSVCDVVAATGTSRRYLEIQFKRILKRSILAEIHHCRLTHLRTLLRTSNLPAADLALRCGFSDANRASIAFKKTFGVTVRDYRREAARVE